MESTYSLIPDVDGPQSAISGCEGCLNKSVSTTLITEGVQVRSTFTWSLNSSSLKFINCDIVGAAYSANAAKHTCDIYLNNSLYVLENNHI